MPPTETIFVEEGEILDIEVEQDLLDVNKKLADVNRKTFDSHGIKVINVMGSIGSGKTSVIQELIKRLREKYKIAVIAGDVSTDIDSKRLSDAGATSIQINTGRGCHLDALMIKRAIKKLNLDETNLIFIENVGNLICPADFPLGEHLKLVIVSVTEGPYMIIKHPIMVKEADVLAINKIDLAEAMGVNVGKLMRDALTINPHVRTLPISVVQGKGIEELIKALKL